MKANIKKACGFLICAVLSSSLKAQSVADNYPSRPITLIQSSTPGGSADIVMRMYSKKIAETTGWNTVMDYKPGAGGVVGYTFAAKQPGDGYTILLINSPFTTTAATISKLPYDPVADFQPIYMTSKATSVLYVHPSLPIRNVKEYVAYAKANPGKINYGTAGTGGISHLSMLWLNQLAGIEVTFIPYKSSADSRAAMIGGQINATNGTLLASIADVKAGRIRPIGSLDAAARSPLLPDLPTIAEQGYPEFSHLSWAGISAPAKTPTAIINKIHAEWMKAALTKEIIDGLAKGGEENGGKISPAEFKQRTVNEINRWRKVAQQAGLELQPI